MNRALIACGIVIIILLTGLKYLYYSYADLSRDYQDATKSLNAERAERERDREQFRQLQGVVDDAAKQKQVSDTRTSELQRQLTTAQIGNSCVDMPVPDSVTHRLRERAAQINAATTSPK